MQNLEIQDQLFDRLKSDIPELVARYISYKLELEGATEIQSVRPNKSLIGKNPRTPVFTIETDKGKSDWESLDPLPYANRIQ